MTRRVLAVLAGVVLATGSTWAGGARPDKSHKNWFGHVALGYSLPQGQLGDIVDDDWAVNGGATYWPEAWPIGLSLDLAWTEYDATSAAIQAINSQITGGGSVTGGNLETWVGTVNALWSPKKDSEGKVGFYVVAGIGAYALDAELTDTGIVVYPPYCDWYWCYGGGVGTGDYAVASESQTEFGWNAGVGVTFDVGLSGSQVYVEAKYHGVEASGHSLEFVPITVGYRW